MLEQNDISNMYDNTNANAEQQYRVDISAGTFDGIQSVFNFVC